MASIGVASNARGRDLGRPFRGATSMPPSAAPPGGPVGLSGSAVRSDRPPFGSAVRELRPDDTPVRDRLDDRGTTRSPSSPPGTIAKLDRAGSKAVRDASRRRLRRLLSMRCSLAPEKLRRLILRSAAGASRRIAHGRRPEPPREFGSPPSREMRKHARTANEPNGHSERQGGSASANDAASWASGIHRDRRMRPSHGRPSSGRRRSSAPPTTSTVPAPLAWRPRQPLRSAWKCASSPVVEPSRPAAGVLPSTIGNNSPASCLPSSTPHWSKELTSKITPWTNTLCS